MQEMNANIRLFSENLCMFIFLAQVFLSALLDYLVGQKEPKILRLVSTIILIRVIKCRHCYSFQILPPLALSLPSTLS